MLRSKHIWLLSCLSPAFCLFRSDKYVMADQLHQDTKHWHS